MIKAGSQLVVLFGDSKVQVRHEEERVLFLLTSVAMALNIRPSNIGKILHNDREFFAPYLREVHPVENQGELGEFNSPNSPGRPAILWIDHPGLVALLMRLQSSRHKNPEIRSRILAFQHWAVAVVSAVLRDDIAALADLVPKGGAIHESLTGRGWSGRRKALQSKGFNASSAQMAILKATPRGKRRAKAAEIAARYGLHPKTIQGWLRRLSAGEPLYKSPRGGNNQKWKQERSEFFRLAAKGMKSKALRALFPYVPKRTQSRWLTQARALSTR